MSRKSLIIGLSVLIIWAITMGALLKNHYFHKDNVPAFSSADFFQGVKVTNNWRDVEEYMLLMRGKDIVGASKTSIKKIDTETTSPIGSQYVGTFALSGKFNDLLPKANVKVTTLLDADINLTKFVASMQFAGMSYSANGQVDQKLLYLTITKPNDISYKKIYLDNPITMSEFARSTLSNKMDIQVGNSLTMPAVNPLSGSVYGSLKVTVESKEPLTIQGRQMSAYKLVSNYNDIRTTMWVSKDGTTLKRQLVGNIAMEKSSRESALKADPNLDDNQPIADLDLSKFKDQPTIKSSTPDSSGATPDLKLLEMLMN